MALSIGSRDSVSFLLTIQATGFLTFALVGLPPTEYANLRWTRQHAGLSRRLRTVSPLFNGRNARGPMICSNVAETGHYRWHDKMGKRWHPKYIGNRESLMGRRPPAGVPDSLLF